MVHGRTHQRTHWRTHQQTRPGKCIKFRVISGKTAVENKCFVSKNACF
nr:MAG TPA: hypothetical protein [Bacteriophage sp.]